MIGFIQGTRTSTDFFKQILASFQSVFVNLLKTYAYVCTYTLICVCISMYLLPAFFELSSNYFEVLFGVLKVRFFFFFSSNLTDGTNPRVCLLCNDNETV